MSDIAGFEVINFDGEKVIRVYHSVHLNTREVHRKDFKSFYSSYHYKVEHLPFTPDNLKQLAEKLLTWI